MRSTDQTKKEVHCVLGSDRQKAVTNGVYRQAHIYPTITAPHLSSFSPPPHCHLPPRPTQRTGMG